MTREEFLEAAVSDALSALNDENNAMPTRMRVARKALAEALGEIGDIRRSIRDAEGDTLRNEISAISLERDRLRKALAQIGRDAMAAARAKIND